MRSAHDRRWPAVLDEVTGALDALTSTLATEDDFAVLLHRMCEQVVTAVPGVDEATITLLTDHQPATGIFPFADGNPTVLLNYKTDDVDAEFTGTPVDRVRAAFGPEPTGRTLGEVLDAMETADNLLFDSVEQARMDRWHRGRVVLVGDSAWCVTLYAGMGVSMGMSGADLLGTMLERHPGNVAGALAA
ncbi:hypothetical protein OG738_39390 [Amycolatopsis sp. NBC_01488]|uniref:FAD-dependent monooxygenase n=1 Tax=Amycolatopsis sp. NBC_01488 TaxID=2903563 RepID=UPI002E29196E|nr:FAD-dependent monooxygenase [Amycolatopsis sp. NBC_01488]